MQNKYIDSERVGEVHTPYALSYNTGQCVRRTAEGRPVYLWTAVYFETLRAKQAFIKLLERDGVQLDEEVE